MMFFKKREEKIDLPPLPEIEPRELPKLPELPNPSEIKPLPKFDSEIESIKTKLSEEEKDVLEGMPKEKKSYTQEMKIFEEPVKRYVNKEPIFVKIDKFRDAVENFEKIKQKVMEIESALKKLNEIKLREEEEIKGWENEMQIIKSRIAEIDESLFSKINP